MMKKKKKMMVVRKAVGGGGGHTRAATTIRAPPSSPVLYIRATKRAERVSNGTFVRKRTNIIVITRMTASTWFLTRLYYIFVFPWVDPTLLSSS